MKSLLVLDFDDLLSKHRQLEETISSYEAIQSRHELVQGPDESLRNAASVGTQHASMESTKVVLEKKIKHVNVDTDIECLVEDITDTLDSTALGSSATQQSVKDINHTYSELNRKARSHLKDPKLKGLWSNLLVLKSRVSSDISKMFCCIHLLPKEKDLHRFLVRSYEGDLKDWHMRHLTFGVTSSPFLATGVLREAASDLSETYPLASATQQSDFIACPVLQISLVIYTCSKSFSSYSMT